MSDAPEHRRERIIPSGTLELVVNLHEDAFCIYQGLAGPATRFRGAIVSGAYPRPFAIDTRGHASIIGVHFRPGGAFPFIDVSPGEVAGGHVELDVLWGASGRELRERLAGDASLERRFLTLGQALLGRLRRGRKRHGVVAAGIAELERPDVRVADVSDRLGVSHRRFIEIFTREVGMAPKLFARVRRFQRAFHAAKATATPDWARLALMCGYFDQAHLIRDFGELAGLSPGKLKPSQSDEVKVNHLPMPQSRGSNSSNTC